MQLLSFSLTATPSAFETFSFFSKFKWNQLSTRWHVCWPNKTATDNYWLFSGESCTKRGEHAPQRRPRTLVTVHTPAPGTLVPPPSPFSCPPPLSSWGSAVWTTAVKWLPGNEGWKEDQRGGKRGRCSGVLTFGLAMMGFAHTSWIHLQKTTHASVPIFVLNNKKTLRVFHICFFLFPFTLLYIFIINKCII